MTPQGVTLQVLAGPTREVFRIEGDGPATIGRSAACDVALVDDTVSRRHATLVRRAGAWFVMDEGSRGGTMLNGVRLPRGLPSPLATGDLLRIGPWALRIVLGLVAPGRAAPTIDDSGSRTQRIERVGASRELGAADRRLALLSACLRTLIEAPDEAAATGLALEHAVRGSGYARGAVLRRLAGGEVEIVASMPQEGGVEFSRTLLDRAANGESVLLTQDAAPVAHGQSLAEMGVHSALCVPIATQGPVTGFLYLDARGREGTVHTDAAGFCEAVAAALGMAVGALRRADVERRQREMQMELDAAREVQTLIQPEPAGAWSGVRYAVRSRPGSFVAGDLVDVTPLSDGRTVLSFGDVSGHGAGSAMLMATARAFLASEVSRLAPGQGPAAAVDTLNRFLCARPLAGRFMSLWVGVLSADGALRYCDAGHGHWLIVRRDGDLRRPEPHEGDGGIPVGIDPGATFGEAALRLGLGDEVVVYSDGITEQRGPEGVFGLDRLREAVVRGRTPEEDVALVFDRLEAFAGTPNWDDDATIVALEYLA